MKFIAKIFLAIHISRHMVVVMNSPAIIADTPEKVDAFRLLAIKGALKLETKGLQMSRGVKASVIVRGILKKVNKKAPANKVELLAAYEEHLREIKVLVS